MPTETKLANECIDCLTVLMRNRLAQEQGRIASFESGVGVSSPKLATNQSTLEFVDSILAARKARLKFFDDDLFFDPTWAMLLDLYRCQLAGRDLCVSSLCIGSGVPETTALRYLRTLEQRAYVERRSDETDRRRSFVRLTSRGIESMGSYIASLKQGSFERSAHR